MRSRKPNRLSTYNNAQPDAYFITTVVNQRQSTFGEVSDGKIKLNRYGDILVEQWRWLRTLDREPRIQDSPEGNIQKYYDEIIKS
jgi:hypothetical protein